MITSDAIVWNAPNDPHPARAASQRSYSAVAKGDLAEWLPEGKGHHGHDGISAFWEKAISPIETFEFTIEDSFANPDSNTCANIGRIRTAFPDGSYTVTELIMVYVVDDDGRVKSMKAFWEPERTMASFTKP
jgi:ketosteroid isomerase-like protein